MEADEKIKLVKLLVGRLEESLLENESKHYYQKGRGSKTNIAEQVRAIKLLLSEIGKEVK